MSNFCANDFRTGRHRRKATDAGVSPPLVSNCVTKERLRRPQFVFHLPKAKRAVPSEMEHLSKGNHLSNMYSDHMIFTEILKSIRQEANEWGWSSSAPCFDRSTYRWSNFRLGIAHNSLIHFYFHQETNTNEEVPVSYPANPHIVE